MTTSAAQAEAPPPAILIANATGLQIQSVTIGGMQLPGQIAPMQVMSTPGLAVSALQCGSFVSSVSVSVTFQDGKTVVASARAAGTPSVVWAFHNAIIVATQAGEFVSSAFSELGERDAP
jgi:hypothetical protein